MIHWATVTMLSWVSARVESFASTASSVYDIVMVWDGTAGSSGGGLVMAGGADHDTSQRCVVCENLFLGARASRETGRAVADVLVPDTGARHSSWAAWLFTQDHTISSTTVGQQQCELELGTIKGC